MLNIQYCNVVHHPSVFLHRIQTLISPIWFAFHHRDSCIFSDRAHFCVKQRFQDKSKAFLKHFYLRLKPHSYLMRLLDAGCILGSSSLPRPSILCVCHRPWPAGVCLLALLIPKKNPKNPFIFVLTMDRAKCDDCSPPSSAFLLFPLRLAHLRPCQRTWMTFGWRA